jgi:hypothetical protein
MKRRFFICMNEYEPLRCLNGWTTYIDKRHWRRVYPQWFLAPGKQLVSVLLSNFPPAVNTPGAYPILLLSHKYNCSSGVVVSTWTSYLECFGFESVPDTEYLVWCVSVFGSLNTQILLRKCVSPLLDESHVAQSGGKQRNYLCSD